MLRLAHSGFTGHAAFTPPRSFSGITKLPNSSTHLFSPISPAPRSAHPSTPPSPPAFRPCSNAQWLVACCWSWRVDGLYRSLHGFVRVDIAQSLRRVRRGRHRKQVVPEAIELCTSLGFVRGYSPGRYSAPSGCGASRELSPRQSSAGGAAAGSGRSVLPVVVGTFRPAVSSRPTLFGPLAADRSRDLKWQGAHPALLMQAGRALPPGSMSGLARAVDRRIPVTTAASVVATGEPCAR